MLRLFNLTRNIGGNLIRSSLREDHPIPVSPAAPQFLLWFNETPGHYTPVKVANPLSVISKDIINQSLVSKNPTIDLLSSNTFVNLPDTQFFNGNSSASFNIVQALRYGAFIAVCYSVLHDKSLFQAIQRKSLEIQHDNEIEPPLPNLLESHCPVLAVKNIKTALAQPPEEYEHTNHQILSNVCIDSSLIPDKQLTGIVEVKDSEGEKPSETSDYSSHKSDSKSYYSLSEEEFALHEIHKSIPTSLSALEAIELLKVNEIQGIDLLQQNSNLGCATSQFFLGQAYEQGIGVSENIELASHYYKKAAECGHPEAKYNLGVLIIKRNENCKDAFKEGLRLIEEAAEEGVFEALLALGVNTAKINSPNLESDVEDLYRIGNLMENHELKDSFDEFFALELYQEAALNGHVLAHEHYEKLRGNISFDFD